MPPTQGWTPPPPPGALADPPSGYGAPPPPAPPAGYGYGYGYPTANQTTNGLAVAAMVCGIVWIYWIGSVLAVVFGFVAIRQIDQSGGAQGGRGMAIAGIVLGLVGLAALLVSVVIFAAYVEEIDDINNRGGFELIGRLLVGRRGRQLLG